MYSHETADVTNENPFPHTIVGSTYYKYNTIGLNSWGREPYTCRFFLIGSFQEICIYSHETALRASRTGDVALENGG